MITKALSGIVKGIGCIAAVTAGAYMPFVISDALKNFKDDCDYLLILGGNVIGVDLGIIDFGSSISKEVL